MAAHKRYALVGTGARSGMYLHALLRDYRDTSALVALCDLSRVRMAWWNEQLQAAYDIDPLPCYDADAFDQMIAETKPDTVIVTTVDATHHQYIIRALDLGCDVITEKPMTTDADKAAAIFEAVERTGRSLRVTFNYRYAPAFTRFRELVMSDTIGRPLHVDFSWMLDVHHGADYFRRWHREKHHSGGLLIHKATHHFDLVNWWINSVPAEVFAYGDLLFYGQENAEQRGEHYAYQRYTGSAEAENDPFAIFLDDRWPTGRDLYRAAEDETGYLRDRNVFGGPITIEDTMCVTARYANGALLSYSLVAYSPWEGLKVAITGDEGRIELDIIEAVELDQDGGDGASEPNLSASKGAFKYSEIRAYPQFEAPYRVEIPAAEGGHGGADPVLLRDLFAAEPPPDPFGRAASHVDGAASILLGISANQSMATRQPVRVADLFKLPHQR